MDISKINDIINSQKDFLNKNSNTTSSRILLLKKLLLNINFGWMKFQIYLVV